MSGRTEHRTFHTQESEFEIESSIKQLNKSTKSVAVIVTNVMFVM